MVGPIRRWLQSDPLWVVGSKVYTGVDEISELLKDFPVDVRNQIIAEMQRYKHLLLARFEGRYYDWDLANVHPPEWARLDMSRRLGLRENVDRIDIFDVKHAPLRVQKVYTMTPHDYFSRWRRRVEPIF